MQKLSAWFHSRTADLCEDYPARPVVNNPPSRPFIRCLIAVVIMIAGVCTIVLLATVYSEKTRSVRHWDGAAYMLLRLSRKAASTLAAAGNSTCKPINSNDTDVVCPCRLAFVPWPLFVKFYWVDKDLQRVPITNNTQFCDPLDSYGTSAQGLWLQGCYEMGNVGFDVNMTRLTLSSPFLQGPESMSYLISSSFRSYIDHTLLNYQVLATNYSRDWLQLYWVSELLQNMASRPFMLSTRLQCRERATMEKERDQIFWNHTRYLWMRDPRHVQKPITNPSQAEQELQREGGLTALQLTRQRAVSMELNWTAYVEWCSPLYCDQVVKNPISRRFITAMSEVGGLAVIILLLVRMCLWPILQRLFRFHHNGVTHSLAFSRLQHPPQVPLSVPLSPL